MGGTAGALASAMIPDARTRKLRAAREKVRAASDAELLEAGALGSGIMGDSIPGKVDEVAPAYARQAKLAQGEYDRLRGQFMASEEYERLRSIVDPAAQRAALQANPAVRRLAQLKLLTNEGAQGSYGLFKARNLKQFQRAPWGGMGNWFKHGYRWFNNDNPDDLLERGRKLAMRDVLERFNGGWRP